MNKKINSKAETWPFNILSTCTGFASGVFTSYACFTKEYSVLIFSVVALAACIFGIIACGKSCMEQLITNNRYNMTKLPEENSIIEITTYDSDELHTQVHYCLYSNGQFSDVESLMFYDNKNILFWRYLI